jgi:hypothetical protein
MPQTTADQNPITTRPKYLPGVCNIGPAERAKRRQDGIVASLITIGLLVVLIVVGAPRGWRLLLILPASAAATGFLQDAFHFCAGFGMKGLYNVINSVGTTDTVTLEEFRRKDRHKALTIIGLSLAIGIVVAVLCTL